MRKVFISLLVINIALFVWILVDKNRQQRKAALNLVVTEAEGMPGEELVLVSEVPDNQKERLGVVPHDKLAEVQARLRAEEFCAMLGPVNRGLVANQLAQRLIALGIYPEKRKIEIPGKPDFWVVIPPAKSRNEAMDRLRILQGRGIDSFLIPQGELQHAISLGMFGSHENAEKHSSKFGNIGYKVEVREVSKGLVETWLFLPAAEAANLSEEVWSGLAEDFPGIEKREGKCAELAVASAQNIQ
jgi:hypothetical protein